MTGTVEPRVRLRLLGSVEMEIGGQPVVLGGAKPRTLLAALLVKPGKTIETSTLIDVVWGNSPPSSARGMIQTYVYSLRRAMQHAGAPDLVAGTGTGYRIADRSYELDLRDFEEALCSARELVNDKRPSQAAETLRSALGLWRGPAFDGLGDGYLRAEADRLEELRLTALELRIAADLDAGEDAVLIPELRGLVAEHPLRERFWASLMLALHYTGQQSAALAVFDTIRARLADEFGADPGPWLREAHDTVLRDQPRTVAAPTPVAIPMQLPADLASFSGRAVDLAGLDDWLPEPGDPAPKTLVISGPGGVGKTALAVHWAHSVRAQFPDGQLFVDLRGYDAQAPISSAQALTRCLRALGVTSKTIPATLDEQIALYRSLLADRRVLVVLDNAANAEQVRPLLPPNSGSLTLVTSRDALRGLTVLNDAIVRYLDVLTPRESRELLTELIDADMVFNEPVAVDDLARLCGYLPLALRIAAANLMGSKHDTIADYVQALSQDRLSELAIEGDPSVAVRSTFHLSYLALDSSTRRLFRLLGCAPGPDFAVDAASALVGTSVGTRRSLDRLVAANLLLSRTAGRYQFHDLIREFAVDQSLREDEPAERYAVNPGLFDFYLRMATEAVAVYNPIGPVEATSFRSAEEALRWLDDERANLVAVVERVAGCVEFCEYGGKIATALRRYFQRRGHASDGLAMCVAALKAARLAGDRRTEAEVLDLTGLIYYNVSEYQQAVAQHTQAREVAKLIGAPEVEAECLHNLGRVYSQLGQPRDTMRCHELELELGEQIGDRQIVGRATNYIGVAHLSLGNIDESIRCHTKALEVVADSADHAVRLAAWNGLGLANWTAGRMAESVKFHQRCVEVGRQYGLLHAAVTGLVCAAEACCDLGRYEDSATYAAEALEQSRRIGERRQESGALEIQATIQRMQGNYEESIRGYEIALEMAEKISFRYGAASIHIGLSAAYRGLNEPVTAVMHANRALDAMYETGMQVLESAGLTELAAGRLVTGDVVQAGAEIDRALRIARERGQRLMEARALRVQGLVCEARSGREAAVPHWTAALAIFNEIGTPEAATVSQLISRA